MTKLEINSGACGFISTVEVRRINGKDFSVCIRSDCGMIAELGEKLKELSMMGCFTRILDNAVYKEASCCVKHVSCPVPSGVLKAVEVEAGLAVAKDVTMKFLND